MPSSCVGKPVPDAWRAPRHVADHSEVLGRLQVAAVVPAVEAGLVPLPALQAAALRVLDAGVDLEARDPMDVQQQQGHRFDPPRVGERCQPAALRLGRVARRVPVGQRVAYAARRQRHLGELRAGDAGARRQAVAGPWHLRRERQRAADDLLGALERQLSSTGMTSCAGGSASVAVVGATVAGTLAAWRRCRSRASLTRATNAFSCSLSSSSVATMRR